MYLTPYAFNMGGIPFRNVSFLYQLRRTRRKIRRVGVFAVRFSQDFPTQALVLGRDILGADGLPARNDLCPS